MERGLNVLFDQLGRRGIDVQERQSIKEVICTLLLATNSKTVGYIGRIEDPAKMIVISEFFDQIITKFKSQWVYDKIRNAIEKFKGGDCYPELMERFNSVKPFFSGLILMPIHSFSVEKAIGDITSVAVDQSHVTINIDKSGYYDSFQGKKIIPDAGLTYSTMRTFRGASRVFNIRFRGYDDLTDKFYGRTFFDWVDKSQQLYHAISIGEIDERDSEAMFNVVFGFIKRNKEGWFYTRPNIALNWRELYFLQTFNERGVLPDDWYLHKPVMPEDFDDEVYDD